MINFPPLRTRRLTVQLRELNIGESIALAAMPIHMEEATTAAFLGHVVKSVKGIEDPDQWTVQERAMVVARYQQAVADDGPDFSVGAGRYSDYLDGAHDIDVDVPVQIGEVGGDVWSIRHLTGAMAQSIERLADEVLGVSGRFHWLLGGMAAQLVLAGDPPPDPSAGEGAFDEAMLNRMRVMQAYPESDFVSLLALYLAGREKLHHLFRIEFARDGISIMPNGGARGDLPPARFPIGPCLSRLAHELV